MIDESFLPKFVYVMFPLLQLENTTKYYATLYYSLTRTEDRQVYNNVLCSVLEGVSMTLARRNFNYTCYIESAYPYSVSLACEYRNVSVAYQCEATSKVRPWKFYPYLPLFYSYNFLLAFTALNGLVFITSLILNGLLTLIFLKSRHLRKADGIISAMHMVVIDLLITLIYIPCIILYLFAKNYYLFKGRKIISRGTDESLMLIARGVTVLFPIVSSSNIALISVERCAGIVKPIWMLRYSRHKRAVALILSCWIYSGLGISSLFLMNATDFDQTKGFIVKLSVFFLGPAIVIIISYTLLLITYWKSKKKLHLTNKAKQHFINSEKKIKMMSKILILIVVFFTCWLPYSVLELICLTNNSWDFSVLIKVRTAWMFSILLANLHTVSDAVLYSSASRYFRKEIKSSWTSFRSSFGGLIQNETNELFQNNVSPVTAKTLNNTSIL